MKKIIAFISAISITVISLAQDSVYLFAYFKNNGKDGLHYAYSEDGYTYTALNNDSSFLTPTAGKDKLMRDPNILRGADGRFHMVWTVSWNEKGIGYASSGDLVHWSEQQYIPVMEKEDSARNCWAPEISYDKKKKQYMIYWATTISGKYPGDAKVENGYNHRMYYVTTKDFTSFSKTKLLYDKGFNVIDASIVDAGNRYVMFLKDETPTPPKKNLRVATAKKLAGPYSEPSAPITGKYWAEGPTAIYTGTQWIVYFDKYRDKQYGAVASGDLVNWTDISEKIHIPKGLRHGTVIKISRSEFTSFFK
ncbi:MAG TPA: glycoside hydrolase family 43 protein [Chitinophagaceae bacterium]|jgi:hypothetical protein|nr:glycoside hydrolase family 43 protein [Chitinophagaceae bacterium]